MLISSVQQSFRFRNIFLMVLIRACKTMRVGVFNFPNTAKLLKGLTLLVCVMLFICILSLAMEIVTSSQSGTFLSKSRQMEMEKYKLLKNSNLVSYKKSICMNFSGRLGNHMFQFASAYGIAKAKNMNVRVYRHDAIAEVFQLGVNFTDSRFHCDRAKAIVERFSCAYDRRLLNINPNFDTKFLSYLQSWKYFENVISDLRKAFTFKQKIMDEAQSSFYNAIHRTKYYGKNGTYVGLHIRRGDMVIGQRHGSRFGYNIAPRAYILRAMNFFLFKHKKVTFVICSDGIKWAKRELGKFANLLQLVFIEKNQPEVDLAVLSLCDHIIMTTGTFSWWAGWLAGGTVIYYKHYVKENSPLRRQFSSNFTDYFYPNWIPME